MAPKLVYDLIIVGGGLVGASLACALRTTGLRIAILEAAPWFTESRPPSYDDRIIALSYTSYRIFSGMKIWDNIAPQAIPIKHIHVSDQGHFGFTHLDRKDLGISALGYVVSARSMGQTLQKALASSSIDILAPAQLLEINNLDKIVEIKIKKDKQFQTLQTSLLVAADGGRSKVRQYLGIPSHEIDYRQTAVIANVTLEYPHQNTAYERFTPSGPLALLPWQNNDCSLVWTCKSDQTDTVMGFDEQTFLKTLQQQFGWRLGRFRQVGQRHTYPLRLVRTQQHTAPRVVVIGNAAHTLHPVAGQGLNLGLRDVASLAEVIMESIKAGTDIGHESSLNRYEAWQIPDQQRIATLTNTFIQIFSNTFPPLAMARNLGLLITDALPPLKKQFVRQMVGLNSHPSRLVRGLGIR
jgi:2-octaprenyl-6-methoxyphenol hydroxylase